jgi:putative transposase
LALAALKGDKTLNELASQHGVHPTLIHAWKKQLLTGAEGLFAQGAKPAASDADAAQAELYEQIGHLLEQVEARAHLRPQVFGLLQALLDHPPQAPQFFRRPSFSAARSRLWCWG